MAMAVLYINDGSGQLLGEIRGGVVTDYLPDTLGSCIGTVNSPGVITSTTDFYPYGEVASSIGSNPSPWGFCGLLGYFTDALNRFYVRARVLRAALTRWLSVDPLWPEQLAYAYAWKNPISISDKSGLLPGGSSLGPGFPGGSVFWPPERYGLPPSNSLPAIIGRICTKLGALCSPFMTALLAGLTCLVSVLKGDSSEQQCLTCCAAFAVAAPTIVGTLIGGVPGGFIGAVIGIIAGALACGPACGPGPSCLPAPPRPVPPPNIYHPQNDDLLLA